MSRIFAPIVLFAIVGLVSAYGDLDSLEMTCEGFAQLRADPLQSGRAKTRSLDQASSLLSEGRQLVAQRSQSAAARAANALGRPLTERQKTAVEEAHLVGNGENGKDGSPARINNYTQAQIRQKNLILTQAGFSRPDIRKLMQDGIVGDPGDSRPEDRLYMGFQKQLEPHLRDAKDPEEGIRAALKIATETHEQDRSRATGRPDLFPELKPRVHAWERTIAKLKKELETLQKFKAKAWPTFKQLESDLGPEVARAVARDLRNEIEKAGVEAAFRVRALDALIDDLAKRARFDGTTEEVLYRALQPKIDTYVQRAIASPTSLITSIAGAKSMRDQIAKEPDEPIKRGKLRAWNEAIRALEKELSSRN